MVQNVNYTIYYITGAQNDRIFRIYGYQFISIDDIFDDITGLKNTKKFAKRLDFGVYSMYIYI